MLGRSGESCSMNKLTPGSSAANNIEGSLRGTGWVNHRAVVCSDSGREREIACEPWWCAEEGLRTVASTCAHVVTTSVYARAVSKLQVPVPGA